MSSVRRSHAVQAHRPLSALAGACGSLVGLAGVAAAFSSCGARTGLDTCSVPGEDRACLSGCGAGTQTCAGGAWTPCAVPVAERACTNACGTGSQTCRDGTWSTCAVPQGTRSCAVPCGLGQQICIDGGWEACIGPEAGAPAITAMLWDFRPLQPPDFGPLEPDSTVPGGLDLGIVETTLGADDTPAYAGDPTTPSTNGAADFFEWYHDSPASLNTTIPLAFGPLPGDPTTFASNNPTFFPVDSELFGNEGPGSGPGPEHNYYFTVAFELTFRYRGGETFRFASDDDSWVFINRTLAVNLGGIHPTIHLAISLDELSTQLGITLGQTYPMHVFYADRRPIEAVLDMEVPAVDFAVCSDGGLP